MSVSVCVCMVFRQIESALSECQISPAALGVCTFICAPECVRSRNAESLFLLLLFYSVV